MTASAIQPAHTPMPLAQPGDFTTEQIDLIKQTVAAGTSDLELALFLEVAKSSGLNPFQRQIYAVMRWDAKARKEKMVIQTGIDGYRLIAARSGTHMGTTDPEFGPVNKEGFPEFARVVVRRLVQGHVAEFPATARWSEYVQMGKEGPTAMWKRMPHTMLGKCAEALALRKAFPAELSGVYSDVEMAQADNAAPAASQPAPRSPRADVTERVRQELEQQQPTAPSDALRAEIVALWKEAAPHIDQQVYGAKYGQWRTDASQAAALRQDLKKVLANVPAPEASPAAGQPTAEVQDVPVVELATAQQRSTLSQHAARAGANDSAGRAALWAYLLGQEKSIGTKELSSEQAAVLIDTMSAWSNDEAAQAFAEAEKAVLPF